MSCLLWLHFPFKEFSVYGKVYLKIPPLNFSPLFHLHCYRQVASIFTFTADFFVKLLILKRLRYSEKKKLHVNIVVPKIQETILYGRRRDVQLEHCFVANVPVSPQNHKLISIII